MNKFIISLDTSTSIGSVALHQGVKLLGYKESLRQRGHTEFVNQAINSLLSEHNLKLQNLSAVALINGPGSFTGLRVSGNIARSLSYSLEIPLIVKTSLFVMAEIWKKEYILELGEVICPVLNAFKNQVFTALYQQDENKKIVEVLSPRVLNVSEFNQFILAATKFKINIFGEGLVAYKEEFENSCSNPQFLTSKNLILNPRADALGELAHFSLQVGSIIGWQEFVPLYLKASDPEEKLSAAQKLC